MRIILKVLAAPIVAVLTVAAAVITFLFCVAGALCTVACVGTTIIAIVLLIGKELTGGLRAAVFYTERRAAYGYNLHQALQKVGREKRRPDHAGAF